MVELIKILNNADCKNILIIGIVHGDEPQGELLIRSYLEGRKNAPKNNLYFIPRLNPSNKRKNLNGVDINRNFPTKNWELIDINDDYFGGFSPNSEKETVFVTSLMEKVKFDAIITIHSPYKIINYDGPAENLANAISNFLDYPVQKDIGYPTPGSLGTYSGIERQIPTITIELDETVPLELLYPKFNKMFDYLTDINEMP